MDTPRERVSILGSQVSRIDLESTLEVLKELVSTGVKHQVVVLPVNSILAARKDKELQRIYNRASLALADGMPVLWAARLLGKPIPGRVAGSDLMSGFSRVAALSGITFFLMGSRPGVPERLAKRLKRRNPELAVVGTYSPPFYDELPREVNQETIRRINAAKADVLWVGLGAPKQDRWIHDNLQDLNVKVAIGVGAAFDICSGDLRRAPLWMQRGGLEWFFRFIMEPRRLFRRYFVDAMPFLPLIIAQRCMRGYRKRAELG